MVKIRLTWRVLEHLDGSSLYQRPSGLEVWYSNDPVKQSAADSLRAKVDAADSRVDRSIVVDLTDAEVDVLRGYVDLMEIGGRDMAWDPDGRADYNAARALLNKIGRRSPW